MEKDINAVNGLPGKKEGRTCLMNMVIQLRNVTCHPYRFDGAEPGPMSPLATKPLSPIAECLAMQTKIMRCDMLNGDGGCCCILEFDTSHGSLRVRTARRCHLSTKLQSGLASQLQGVVVLDRHSRRRARHQPTYNGWFGRARLRPVQGSSSMVGASEYKGTQ